LGERGKLALGRQPRLRASRAHWLVGHIAPRRAWALSCRSRIEGAVGNAAPIPPTIDPSHPGPLSSTQLLDPQSRHAHLLAAWKRPVGIRQHDRARLVPPSYPVHFEGAWRGQALSTLFVCCLISGAAEHVPSGRILERSEGHGSTTRAWLANGSGLTRRSKSRLINGEDVGHSAARWDGRVRRSGGLAEAIAVRSRSGGRILSSGAAVRSITPTTKITIHLQVQSMFQIHVHVHVRMTRSQTSRAQRQKSQGQSSFSGDPTYSQGHQVASTARILVRRGS